MLEDVVFSHQMPYYGLDTVEDMISDADNEWQPELCCTRKEEAGLFGDAMGSNSGIGVFVTGTVTKMFNRDVGSVYNNSGRRTALISGHEVTDYKDLVPCGDTPYCEIWLIPKQIVGLWVTKKKLKVLNKKYLSRLNRKGYPVTVIE